MDTRTTQPYEQPRPAALQQPWLPHLSSEEPPLEPSDTRHPFWFVLFVLAVALLFAITAYRAVAIHQPGGDHYLYLAHHLARGQLNVDDLPGYYPDYVDWQGHKYLPFGPLPGVALLPFVSLLPFAFFLPLGLAHDFSWVGHIYSILNIWLFWKVLGCAGVIGERRRWALLLFFGGTIYFAHALVSNSWYFAHVITTTCLLMAMWEALGKRRPVLMGIFLGLAGLARFTCLFALPFFLWLLWRGTGTTTTTPGLVAVSTPDRRFPHIIRTGLLLLGVAGPVLLMLLYNHLRFGNPFENGYALAVQSGLQPYLATARDTYGVFSLMYIPQNLWYLLFQGPLSLPFPFPGQSAIRMEFPYAQPSAWGMGLFFTSPALLYGFRARLTDPLVQACLLGIIFVLLPLVTYFGIGWVQFGFRYALDFMPLMVLLAARGLPKPLTNISRALILASVAINIWGALFLMHWQFDVPKI
ncbi:MAG TPA: hypothetical protein VGE45_10895 [Chloroflexia bacterium]|jgi:hypothetical protein